ncbi:MAG: hypothetical protein E7066_09435 [Lentimicrobiaceae bacterium]|nr:hypothetical protein [Lentimicrobiaceae bacterium]
MKSNFLILLILIPFLGISQTNKGNSYIEVKTGMSMSDVTEDTRPISGYNLNVGYSYGLIENMDLLVSFSTYDAFSTKEPPTFVRQMYFCNAMQLGVRGKIRCLDIVNIKLSLSGGMMIYAYNDVFYHADYPLSKMKIRPCISGMGEIDFNVSEKVALGVFYGKAIALNDNINPYFDSAGITISLKL